MLDYKRPGAASEGTGAKTQVFLLLVSMGLLCVRAGVVATRACPRQRRGVSAAWGREL